MSPIKEHILISRMLINEMSRSKFILLILVSILMISYAKSCILYTLYNPLLSKYKKMRVMNGVPLLTRKEDGNHIGMEQVLKIHILGLSFWYTK